MPTGFLVADKVLTEAWDKTFHDPDVKSYVARKKVMWRFVPSYAPFQAGAWGRLVKLVKSSLLKAVGKITLTYDQLSTLVTEIQATVNTRPLLYTGSDLRDNDSVITPNHFLSLNSEVGTPVVDEGDDLTYLHNPTTSQMLLSEWGRLSKHLDKFWTIWKESYLQSLRDRKNLHTTPRVQAHNTPSKNDVVLVHDRVKPRGSWEIAKVMQLHDSNDGQVRHVTLHTPGGRLISRTINKCYPLEFAQKTEKEAPRPDHDNSEGEGKNETISQKGKNNDGNDSPSNTNNNTPPSRPTRKAKTLAKQKIKGIYQNQSESDSNDDV